MSALRGFLPLLIVLAAVTPSLAQEAPPDKPAAPKEGEAPPEAPEQAEKAREPEKPEGDAALRERLAKLEERVVEQDRRLEQLESEGAAMRRVLEEQEEDESPKLPVKLGLYFIESLDGENRLRLINNAVFHATFNDNDDFNDSFEVRFLRPALVGTVLDWVDFNFEFEFGRTDAADLRNAHITLRPFGAAVALRVGQQRLPFTMAWGIPFWALLHPERPIAVFDAAFPFQLGAIALGSFFEGKVNYAIGLFNGNGANVRQDNDYDKDLVARVDLRPVEGLRLGFGVVFTPNNRSFSGPTDVLTVGDQLVTFVDYNTANNRMAGPRLRSSIGAEYIRGPFRVMADLIFDQYEDLQLRNAPVSEDLTHVAWYVDVSYVLTGEKKTRLVTPTQPFYNDGELGTGAIELALRVEEYKADSKVLRRGFATGTDQALSETVTLNWYLDKGLLASFSYTHTEFQDRVRNSRGRKRHGDNSVIVRLLLRF